LATQQKDDPQAQETLAGVCFMMAITLADLGDVTSSMDYYRRSAAIREAIIGGSPSFREQVQTRLAGVYGYMASDANLEGDPGSALELEHRAHEILAAQGAAYPQNAMIQQFLLESEYWSGYYAAKKGLYRQALPYYRTALAGYAKLSAADARDVLAKRYLGLCHMSMGAALAAVGNTAQGIQHERQAVQIFSGLAATDSGDAVFKPVDLADSRSALARTYEIMARKRGIPDASRIANWRDARTWYQQSLDTWLELKRKAQLGRFEVSQPDKIAEKVAECDAAIKRLERQ